MDRTVVGLLDADSSRRGLQVQGVKVLGDVDDLSQLVDRYDIDEVIVPVQNTTENSRRRLVEACTEAGVGCKHFAFSLQPAVEAEAAPSSAAGDGAREWTRPSP
jgi:FlaA1/EpsC-like NDP-sugar epimerase